MDNYKREHRKAPKSEREHNGEQRFEKGILRGEDFNKMVRQRFGAEAMITILASNIEGNPYIAKVVHNGTEQNVLLSLEQNEFVYSIQGTGEVIARSLPEKATDRMMLEEVSRERKIVKSRPAFLYPDLLGVDYEELFPKGAKIAIIGDPYVACDFENGTIIEYEFGEEIMPSFLNWMFFEEEYTQESDFFERASTFYGYLDREDMGALGRIGHDMERPWGADEEGNPYWQTVHDLHLSIGTCAELIEGVWKKRLSIEDLKGAIEDGTTERVNELKDKVRKLIDGSWERRDYQDEIADEHQREVLDFYFNVKQRTRDNQRRGKEWNDFTNVWTAYLQGLPKEKIGRDIPDFEGKMRYAIYWIDILPKAGSPEQIRNGMKRLEDFYSEMLDWGMRNPDEKMSVWNDRIEDTRNTGMANNGFFGIDIPGHVLPRRVEEFLQRTQRRAESMMKYATKIFPQIYVEMQRMRSIAPEMNDQTLYQYLKSHEVALIRSIISIPTPKRAVALRGFFPDTVNIEQQDRIIALTSVTMHGWNRLDKAGFKKNIVDALPSLKRGGKYILGPINQAKYFSGYDDGFDCQGLTSALQELRDEGMIEYAFVKGRRDHFDEGDLYEETEETFSEDEQVLLPGECAKSLVITLR